MRLLRVDLLQLADQVTRLLDEVRLRHLGQLRIQLCVEGIQLLDLVLHALSL